MKKYKIIYADPPWKYGSKSAVNNSTGSDAKKLDEHYPQMSLKELQSMDVESIADKDCALFMWVGD